MNRQGRRIQPQVGPSVPPEIEVSPNAVVPCAVGDLAEWQLRIAAARSIVLAEAELLCEQLGVDKGLRAFVELVGKGAVRPEIVEALRQANARRRTGERPLCKSTLYGWRALAAGAVTPAERLTRLAPDGAGKKWGLDQDLAAVLAKYRSPNKPSLRWCVAQVANERGCNLDSLYSSARRQIAKLPKPVFYVGRNTGAALKALQPFRRRDFLALAPNDVWSGDGHSAKLRIAHPDTGNPFVPEVTMILDVATRYIVGWSVSLSENCLAVSDALRHGVSRHGIPLVYYSDNGGGQKNKMLDAPVTGILGGLGIHHETGIPGNAQGRGAIERLWPSATIPLARRFATFQGRGADRDTLRSVAREIDRGLRAAKRGDVTALPKRLPTWQEFLDALEDDVEAYNRTHRHRSLPKLDGVNHATPAEYRAARLAGTEVQVPPPAELQALFMPSVMRLAARGEVRLWNGIYFHPDLMLVDGERVRVCYDIHHVSYVLVRKASGEFICRAELGGNSSSYMPLPFIERLREERAARQRARLEAKLAGVEAERRGSTTTAPGISAEEMAQFEREFTLEPPQEEKPIELMGDSERYALWKSLHKRKEAGEQIDGRMAQFYAGYAETGLEWLEMELEFERRMANR